MDSYASAAERQGSFTTQASSRADSFHDAADASRVGSFVSASGTSFPSRFNSATSGGQPTGSLANTPQQETRGLQQAQGRQFQALDVDVGSLTANPPSQQQGWR